VRFKSKTPKLLIKLNGRPVIGYCLKVFSASSAIDSIILAVPKDLRRRFAAVVRSLKLAKPVKIIEGGATRCESVHNGIKALDTNTKIVMVHDGARPFLSQKLIADSITLLRKHKSVIAAVPVKSTIKKIDSGFLVKETLDRNTLWEVQTPQTFCRDLLTKAHRKAKDKTATDDACLVEELGEKVHVVMGEYLNIKITTPEDLILAGAILRTK